MTATAPNIVAVGHDAYRAGAQIAFLHILRWLRANHPADISLLLRSGGALLGEYRCVLPTTVLPKSLTSIRASGVRSVPARVRQRIRRGARSLPEGVKLVYANSVVSTNLAVSLASEADCPVICHVHELEMSMRRFGNPDRFSAALEQVDGFIAVSAAVEQNLIANHGVEADKIVMIHEAIPMPDTPVDQACRAEIRKALRIPDGAILVGGCGTVDWRKGPDVFVLVAKAVQTRQPRRPVHFVWVGGEPGPLETMHHDIERLGLDGTVTLVGTQPNPTAFFQALDVFLLTSREDPFPLVCLEAASVGVPIVCFADAGGIPELVGDDAGFAVPYLDVGAAADSVLSLVESDSLRSTLGLRAAAKVAERCSIEVIGPKIASIIDRYAALR